VSEQPTAPAAAAPKRENVFTHKLGPLPMWGWVAIAGGILVAWRWYSNKQAASTATASTSATGNPNTVPQFVNQTYVSTQPPVAPSAATPATPAAPAAPTPVPGAPTPVSPTPSTTRPATITPRPMAATPAPPKQTYVVKPGDTLASVAKKYGISVATLAHANVYVPGEVAGNKKVGQPLGTGAGLKTGQVLTIP
jgi:LysM repeat protein